MLGEARGNYDENIAIMWSSYLPVNLPPVVPSVPLLLMLAANIVIAQDHDMEQQTEAAQRLCLKTAQCRAEADEVCWWFYSGCPMGQCRCDPRWRFLDAYGRCRRMKLGNEPCASDDKCPDGMTCSGGRCVCNTGTLTPDHTFCLKRNERLLREMCNDLTDICYQKSARGYTSTEVVCTPLGTCRCREGYKETGSSCNRWNIGERGCMKNYQCHGGALCIDGFCNCPTGYEAGAGNSKCVRQGATFDLTLGASCDEIHEKHYCAQDYVCHKCAGQQNYTCVKFLESQHRRYVSGGLGLNTCTLTISITMAFHLLIVSLLRDWTNR